MVVGQIVFAQSRHIKSGRTEWRSDGVTDGNYWAVAYFVGKIPVDVLVIVSFGTAVMRKCSCRSRTKPKIHKSPGWSLSFVKTTGIVNIITNMRLSACLNPHIFGWSTVTLIGPISQLQLDELICLWPLMMFRMLSLYIGAQKYTFWKIALDDLWWI